MNDQSDKIELAYLRNVSEIQDKYIKEHISKKECEELLVIERFKYMIQLKRLNDQLNDDIRNAKMFDDTMASLKKENTYETR